ncbi:DHH phosphoesterase [Mollisia scopiformis]|uniref:DHH phosphoesterase n=1 Tax=Mollisia scopiformis TaxID=149040 RepID=A0A194XWV2_MOLSC|nr:DHH phosphoesterase [Mollisia scopiformis]KUJ24631.1 DHH phosphoesterase [Mollisia scopiformis]
MYIYDEILRIYINTSPLMVSIRVLQAVRDIDPPVQLSWDDHGFVCGVSHDVAMQLTKELGMRMLWVHEFMQLAHQHHRVALRYLHLAQPGWFNLDEIDHDGLPTTLSPTNQPGLWKFWSPESTEHVCGAVRSFVTSSGTCSLDLGIPIFAKHPKIMLRECYEKLEPPVPSPLCTIWPKYEKLIHLRDTLSLQRFLKELDISKISISIEDYQDDFLYNRGKERLIDLIDKRRLLEREATNLEIIHEAQLLSMLCSPPDDQAFFVIGHARPDADSVVSSVFEAMRRHLVYPNHACLPWSKSIPREVEHILGPEVTGLMSKISPPRRNNSIVLVDCHQADPKYQMGVRAIIDHHILNGKQFPYYMALSHEVSWSTTIQVYVKILGSGLDLSPGMAKTLLEATRLEAEPSLIPRMSETDQLAIARLESIAGYGVAATYEELMSIMLNTAEIKELFYKDYRQTSYGFSVIKSNKSNDFGAIAEAKNRTYHLPLTVVKEVVYAEDFSGVCLENISLVINPVFHDKGFKNALQKIVTVACQHFHGKECLFVEGDSITLKDIESQTPRLLLMPLIETIVNEHMRFRYAASINRYISLGFYSGSQEHYGSPGDEAIVKSGLSFFDKVYREMETGCDSSALKSLQHDRYVKLLDTFISGSNLVTHGTNAPQKVDIQAARPALIRASEADEVTGLPSTLHSPDNYGNNSLWRYWSSDAVENVATRGHIFVMDQTSIDLKVRPDERTKQLTFRPVYKDIPDLKVEVEDDGSGKWVKVNVSPRLFFICG